MDITQAQNIIGWIIGIGASSVIAIIIGIFSIIRSGKMLPKELEGADLKNKQTEVDIAAQMDTMLTSAIAKATEWQTKFDRLDSDARDNKLKLSVVQETYARQEDMIKIQGARILALEALSETQKCEIVTLTVEVTNYSLWTTALVAQLERVNLKPVRMEEVDGVDLSAIRGKSDGKKNK
jgi:hypothetical protein